MTRDTKTLQPARSPSTDAPSAGGDPAAGDDRHALEALRALRLECPFGPDFFLTHLTAFVRDRCPDPSERLPAVQVHLRDGAMFSVCHVIGLAGSWTALAVDDREVAGVASMRTEIVPYQLIDRVTVRALEQADDRIGFTPRAPEIL